MKEKEKSEKLRNTFLLRLYNTEVIKSINELFQTDKFESYNELLGYAVGLGIEKIYLEYGKKKILTKTVVPAELPIPERLKRLERIVKDLKFMIEDVYIMQNCQETMLATVYNVERADFDGQGQSVSGELMDSGRFSSLPPFVESVKDKLTERFKRKQKNTEKEEN